MSFDFDYYDDNGEDAGFRWPNQFCSDPLWIDSGELGHENGSPFNASASGAFRPHLPILTECMRHAVMSQIPPLFLLLTLPVMWVQLSGARRELCDTRRDRTIPRGILTTMINTTTVLLFGLKAVLLVKNCYDWLWAGENVPIIEFLYPIIHMVTLIVLLHYSEQYRLAGLVSSGPVFCTWLMFVIVGSVEFGFSLYTTDNNNVPRRSTTDFMAFLITLAWWPLCCLQLLLHLFTETAAPSKWEDEVNSSPEPRASFVSRQLFCWLDPLVWRGHRKPLAERDVFGLEPSLRAKRLFHRWTCERQRQAERECRPPGFSGSPPTSNDHGSSNKHKPAEEGSPLLGQRVSRPQSYGGALADAAAGGGGSAPSSAGGGIVVEPPAAPSVVACLWRLFKWEVSGAMVLKLFSDLLQFVSPLLLGQLITFTEDPLLPAWLGYLLAVGLFGASELRSLFLNNYFVQMNMVSTQVQSVLTSAVFAKTLRLSNGARRGRTSGEIQNLMAIDVDRFQQITPLLQQLWSAPFQVTVSLILLYKTIGWAVVGGVFVMVALIPCNLVVVRFTKRWQMEQMKCKDERLRTINEVLSGIRAVKLYAWEAPMMEQIEAIRRHEIYLLRKSALFRAITEVLNVTSPFFVAILSFGLYTIPDPVGHPLTPAVAFVSLTLFSQLRVPMLILAEVIAQLVQTAVSNRRLKEFMVDEEVQEGAVQREQDPEFERAIDVEFASFDWQHKHRVQHDALPAGPAHRHALSQPAVCVPYTLNNVELHIRRGLLTAIVGKVGAGKSSLLSAMLGEMHKVYGYVGIRGTVAYVPQQPWILNRTVRENILFPISEDEKSDEEHYANVVDACALRADFTMLLDGDQTEIGEKGINLSGGQKARVNLARALYRRADVYLLDDPLSAVDATTGRHMFEQAIGPSSMINGCTRILVTHSLAYLNQCDWIVVLDGGQVKSQGTFTELLKDEQTAKMIARLDNEATAAAAAAEEETTAAVVGAAGVVERNSSSNNGGHLASGEESGDDDDNDADEVISDVASMLSSTFTSSPHHLRRRRHTRTSSKTEVEVEEQEQKLEEAVGKLVKAESAETGHVHLSVYRDYFAAMRWPLFIGFVLFMLLQSGLSIVQSFWLSDWSDDNLSTEAAATAPPGTKMSLGVRLGVYSAEGMAIVVFLALSYVFQIMGSVSASIRLHGPLLERILHAPVSFFDTTPLGRVLNRFGKEFDTVDLRLAGTFRFLSISLLLVLQVMLIIAISTPLFILLDIPIMAIYILLLLFFIPTSRQLQRLTSVSRSPLYNLFAETINGTTSIRAFGVAQPFFDNFCNKLDAHIGFKYFSLMVNRWLSIRIELIGNIVILGSASLAVLSRQWGSTTAGLIGLSVSRSLDITFMLAYLIRNINDFELSVVSVERILDYMKCPQEASWRSAPGHEPPTNWPGQGEICFQNFSCRYRPELELSLRSISADIRPQEKVGVVGRTGAGKTSFALALFRIVEAAGGRILIDGLDIARVGLQELRSRITIIPQDPVLFSGTLRFNLDPFGTYSDNELWSALDHVHLRDFVHAQPDALSHQIAEGGENISVGQRQLLCLARAILRRSTVIVLDEATASIDAQTDALIQKAIRSEFQHSTVITIAHRISTVMDYDRIMVMSAGQLVEFDTPINLMANKQSRFYELVATHGDQQQQQPTTTTTSGTASS